MRNLCPKKVWESQVFRKAWSFLIPRWRFFSCLLVSFPFVSYLICWIKYVIYYFESFLNLNNASIILTFSNLQLKCYVNLALAANTVSIVLWPRWFDFYPKMQILSRLLMLRLKSEQFHFPCVQFSEESVKVRNSLNSGGNIRRGIHTKIIHLS